MSCDLITQVLPQAILDSHRTLNPTMTVMLYDSTKFQSINEKSGCKDDDLVEYIGIEDSTSRLLTLASQADLDDELDIRLSLLQKFPRVHFYSQLRDSHLYIFKKWVIDYIAKSKSISSIRLDLVPLLLECQYRPNLVKKEGIDKLLLAHSDPFVQAYAYSSRGQKKEGVSCTAVVCRDSLSVRLNKRSNYSEMNRYVVKDATSRIAMNTEISPKTQVGQDSMVGDGSKIGDRCSVKKSVVGSHCTIGQNVKISGSIIMDYVTIEDGVSLVGCIICNGAIIQSSVSLKQCDVGSKFVVTRESKIFIF
jgi:translation initiation factor eIF-2B subunit gamma